MEPEVRATTAKPNEWVNDWDLLSPRFQREATAYLQVIGVVVAVFLVKKRARGFMAPWRRASETAGDTGPSGTVSAPSQSSTEVSS